MAQRMVMVSTGGLMGISTLVILSMTWLEDTERCNMLPAEIPTLVILKLGRGMALERTLREQDIPTMANG